LKTGVDLLDHDTTILNSVSKMMPFDTNVFRSRSKLVRLVDKFKATSVIFVNDRLVHARVDTRLLVKKRKVGYAGEVKTFGKLRKHCAHREEITKAHRQAWYSASVVERAISD
jgi:hypothetical protein